MRTHSSWLVDLPPVVIVAFVFFGGFLPYPVLAQPVQDQSGSDLQAQGFPVQELPVTRVALFSSGVGYFEHRGLVHNDAVLSLPPAFP